MTYCVAVGAVANALLPRTKGEGMGLLAIALCVGLGIGLPIAMFWRVSACPSSGRMVSCHAPRCSCCTAASTARCSLLLCLPGSPSVLQLLSCPLQVSAFFNPGILMAETVRGRVAAGDFWALLAAELVGYFAGESLLFLPCSCS